MRSSYNFMDFLGGASTGAGVGANFGPAGLAAGAGVGALMSLGDYIFGSEPEQYTDPYKSQREAAASQLMNSKLGEKGAANAAGKFRRNALDQYEMIESNPNFQGNANVLSRSYNTAMNGAERGIISANIAGAEQDARSYEKGADMLQDISRDNMNVWNYNKQIRDMPSYFETMGENSIAGLAGKGIEKSGQPGFWGDDGSAGAGAASASTAYNALYKMMFPA